MKLEIKMAQDHYLSAEDLVVTVQLQNPGPGDAELPLPVNPANDKLVYTLTRPGQAAGETFTARSALWEGPGPIPAAPPALKAVKAGGKLSGTFKLQQWRPLDRAGRYTLQARLDWNGATAVSNPVTFTFARSTHLAVGLGVDTGLANRQPLQLAWLAEADGQRTLGQAQAFEKRPDLGEVKVTGSNALRAVGADASEPFIPAANFNTSDGLWGWTGWREGRSLFALQMAEDHPQSFDLGSPGAALVRPGLTAAPKGDLDQFVLSQGGAELSLVRFSFVAEGGHAVAPAALWKLPLPSPARAARAVLGPLAQGSPRRVVLVSQEAGGVAITEVDAGDGAKASPPRSVRLPGGRALAHSEPGVAVDDQGATRVALVFGAGDPAGVRLAMAEAVFPGPGHPGSPSVKARPLVTLEPADKVAAAAATWRVPGMGSLEHRWLVLLESGEALTGATDRRLRFPVPPARPLELVLLGSATYLLLLDPAAGASLHALH